MRLESYIFLHCLRLRLSRTKKLFMQDAWDLLHHTTVGGLEEDGIRGIQ